MHERLVVYQTLNFAKSNRTRALVHSKRELGLNSKPRHFKPFEYFDHTANPLRFFGHLFDFLDLLDFLSVFF